jgi:nuclear-control-of-ATPase protein 2
VVFASLRWLSNTFVQRKGTKTGRKQGRMLSVLRSIDRIMTAAQPSELGVLYYKDYGLLLCESHVLRQIAQKSFPNKEFREFLGDLEELTDIQIGVERQKNVIQRIRWGYSRWF